MQNQDIIYFNGHPEMVERINEVAEYFIMNHSTIRNTAKEKRISKSTVQKDLSDTRLGVVNYSKFLLVREIINYNIKMRSYNGGQVTAQKYEKIKKLSV